MKIQKSTVVYLSMEYGIDQALKIYSGGLGFLAGSHLRATYQLKKDFIAIGILYKNGYHDQVRNSEGFMEPGFIKKEYSFLEDTGIIFPVRVHGAEVKVKVFLLPPQTFNTSPLYLLSTDFEDNDFLSRTITSRLYDSNLATKIAQYMILGIGGGKLVDILGIKPQAYHLNEGHGLPLLFFLLKKYNNINKVKELMRFTTHTPERAGNDEIDVALLEKMNFFSDVPVDEVAKYGYIENNNLNFTLTALRMSKIANGVSALHKEVSNQLWGSKKGDTEILHITNAQDAEYWMDKPLESYLQQNDDEALVARKQTFKTELFRIVADQTGKLFDPDVLTIVWARRFAGYKRADLLLHNFQRFVDMVTNNDKPVQVIWAGKAYPEDLTGINQFNDIISRTQNLKRCAVLIGYEIYLSKMLKCGADIWLNNPRFPKEASGTSGMTAAMNGAINFSIPDGWIPEFATHNHNSFIIPTKTYNSVAEHDHADNVNMMNILNSTIIPMYYNDKQKWLEIMKNSMKEVVPAFDSKRMVRQYYEKIYDA